MAWGVDFGFEEVREFYYPFESGLKAGTAEVYKHEIPGGQYSNLRPQVNALGIGDRFEEVKSMYALVNELLGDLIKVTPSSKVVGDMAIFMVTNNLTPADILERGDELSFPESIISFFKGDLGQPYGGFPKQLQKIILKDRTAFTDRPNAHLEPIDFEADYTAFIERFQKGFSRKLEMEDFLSFSLYPKVFEDAYNTFKKYDNVSVIPTVNFFYGMKIHEETLIEIAPGKTIIVKLLSLGNPTSEGYRTVFFKVNGQTRFIEVLDKSLNIVVEVNTKADLADVFQIGAPLQGMLSKILVKKGDTISKNSPLFVIEAMKMVTNVSSPFDGKISSIEIKAGAMVKQDDLIIVLE